MATRPRLPNFIIIGMMKSGTSSLHHWLGQQPECSPVSMKEPDFFSSDRRWERGLPWYTSLFAGVPEDKIFGEASTSYSKPATHIQAARRMAATVPRVRLVYVLRHPVERLRSHYRHELCRSREQRPLIRALSAPGNDYVEMSKYYSCLTPYISAFPREQICVVRFEDLVSEAAPGWTAVLEHLGLEARPSPRMPHNVTATKPHFTRPMLWMWSSGYYQRSVRKLPRPVRRAGRSLLVRSGPHEVKRLDQSLAPIPQVITEPVWQDIADLERWLGVEQPLWDPTSGEGGADLLPGDVDVADLSTREPPISEIG